MTCQRCNGDGVVMDAELPEMFAQCDVDCERTGKCRWCGRTKAPHGRSISLDMEIAYCTASCKGYAETPEVGHLWPGEWERLHEQTCPECGGAG